MRLRWVLWLGLACGALVAAFPHSATAASRRVVILLFDGWAPSLLESAPAPNMQRLRQEGAWSHHLEPAFPSISLINQTTISTGCWPERHGILSNIFLDPEKGLYDHSPDGDWLIGCEPLHQVAERQGVRAAAMGWPGRYSGSRGELASHTSRERKWEDFPNDAARADQVLALLRDGDEAPGLILAYFHGPDNAAHFHGLDSHEARQAVIESDKQVGRILAAIESSSRRDSTVLFVTTDHGMVDVSTNVNVKKILANHGIQARFRSSGTTSFLYFDDPGQIDAAYRALSAYEPFEVFRKQDQPEYSHLGTGPRVGDLILSAHPPYFMEDIDNWPWWARWLGSWGPEFLWARYALKATHGYPPDVIGVEGILYAWGDGIAAGRQVDKVRAVDIHPTAAHLLGITPGHPMDGNVAAAFLAR